MFDDRVFNMMHSHGDKFVRMDEVSHHDAAQHDPEGGWRQGTRFFRCRTCPEEIVVEPSGGDQPDTGRS
jgi:hypothetical protein